ncbi:hypothetical protein [Paludisphaera soli]|uniref:hypothetical protein n=1 Tax=Paludisphaera soli TaxID=2712865 RepID=UPI0013ED5410|nr:hypothetical protein [Paludisphaera soli]
MSRWQDQDFAGILARKPIKRVSETPPVRAWTDVNAVNLPVPLWMGWIMGSDSGRVGMVLGVVVVYLIGRRICFTSPQEMRTVTRGGWLVAALQFFPIPQMVAGTIGVELVRGFALAQPGELGTVDTLLGGFLATLTTGGILVVVAAAFGAASRGLRRAASLSTEG